MMRNRISTLTNSFLLTVSCLLISSSSANASIVSLSFDSLPSAQGWTFTKTTTGSHAGNTEEGTFSVASNILTMDTIDDGLVSPSHVAYVNDFVIDESAPWTFTWTVRIVEYETLSPTFFGGSSFSVYTGVSVVAAFLMKGQIHIYDDSATPIPMFSSTTTNFQDYRFEFTPDGGNGTYAFYVNDSLIHTGAARASSSSPNRLFIGDATGAANSHWEMTSLVFSQVDSAVPEPSSILLLGIGSVFCVGFRRFCTFCNSLNKEVV